MSSPWPQVVGLGSDPRAPSELTTSKEMAAFIGVLPILGCVVGGSRVEGS